MRLDFLSVINDFKEHCRAKGGNPVIRHYDSTCFAPGAAIDFD
jgi:hypothetical protein